MSVPTKPTFVHYGDLDSTTRKLPVLEFLERFRDDYDKGSFDPKWYTSDLTYIAPDGKVAEGREKSIEALKAMYGPLPRWRHEAFYLNCYETESGYEMVGKATLWLNLPGEPATGEDKRTDGNGNQWDLAVPGTFTHQYVPDGNGFALKRIEIIADTSQIVIGMWKRGAISSKDLGIA
jgi:hypothetical protein